MARPVRPLKVAAPPGQPRTTDKVIRIFLSVMRRMVQFARTGQARYQVGRIGQNQSCKVVRNDKDRCESHPVKDWNVKMKSKKKQKKLRELAQELDVPLRAVKKLVHYCE